MILEKCDSAIKESEKNKHIGKTEPDVPIVQQNEQNDEVHRITAVKIMDNLKKIDQKYTEDKEKCLANFGRELRQYQEEMVAECEKKIALFKAKLCESEKEQEKLREDLNISKFELAQKSKIEALLVNKIKSLNEEITEKSEALAEKEQQNLICGQITENLKLQLQAQKELCASFATENQEICGMLKNILSGKATSSNLANTSGHYPANKLGNLPQATILQAIKEVLMVIEKYEN